MQPVAKEAVSKETSDGDEEAPSEEAGSEGACVEESSLMDLAYSVAFCRAVLGLHRQVCPRSDKSFVIFLRNV